MEKKYQFVIVKWLVCRLPRGRPGFDSQWQRCMKQLRTPAHRSLIFLEVYNLVSLIFQKVYNLRAVAMGRRTVRHTDVHSISVDCGHETCLHAPLIGAHQKCHAFTLAHGPEPSQEQRVDAK